MKKWAQFSKKQKLFIFAFSAGVIVGGVVGGHQVYAINQETSARQTLEKKLSVLESEGELTIAISQLEDSAGYLSKDITEKSIDKLREQLISLMKETNTYKKQYDKNVPKTLIKEVTEIGTQLSHLCRIQDKLIVQGKVNSLFQEEPPAITGSEVAQDLVISDNTTKETVEKIALSDQDFDNDKWFESISGLVTEASSQLEQIEKADQAVAACYKDEKVDSGISKKTYEAAEKAVKVIKRETDKDRLSKKLTDVKKVVDANEKKAKEKAEKEKQEQAQQAAADVAVQEDSDVEVGQEVSIGTDQSVNTNTNNTWANGNASNGGNSGSNTNTGSGSGGSTGNGSSNNNNSSGNTSNAGGNTNGSNSMNPGGGSTTPEKPYALNPYTGSGTFYATYEAANAAGKANLEARYFDIITEFWSDGTEKYYLEFH